MAARTKKIRHDEETRAKIKTSQLINRLQDYILSNVQLEPGQVTAALGLMKKTLPDLSAVDAAVDLSGEITVRATKEQRDAAVSAALRANTDA